MKILFIVVLALVFCMTCGLFAETQKNKGKAAPVKVTPVAGRWSAEKANAWYANLPPMLPTKKIRELAGHGYWKPYLENPVLACGAEGEFDHSSLGTPCIIKVGDFYHMYYETWEKDAPEGHFHGKKHRFGGAVSYERARGDYTTLHIGHAISRDGLNWEKDPGNPVIARGSKGAWDNIGTWDPFVIHEDGIFKMWYGAGEGQTCDWAYAESKDGTHFEKKGRISHLGELEDCHVVHDATSGKYRMYFWNRQFEPMGLHVAESDDEMNFDFANAKKIQIEGEIYPGRYKFTHVIREDGRWYMFYANFTRPHSWDAITRLAVSDDGINWKTVNRNLLSGHDAEVIKADEGLYLMYYGPLSYFDAKGCDIRLAIYEGKLTDLFRIDGTAYDQSEIDCFKELTGKKK